VYSLRVAGCDGSGFPAALHLFLAMWLVESVDRSRSVVNHGCGCRLSTKIRISLRRRYWVPYYCWRWLRSRWAYCSLFAAC